MGSWRECENLKSFLTRDWHWLTQNLSTIHSNSKECRKLSLIKIFSTILKILSILKSPFVILCDSPVFLSSWCWSKAPRRHNNIWPSQSLSARPRADRVSWLVTLQWHSVTLLSSLISWQIVNTQCKQWAHLASYEQIPTNNEPIDLKWPLTVILAHDCNLFKTCSG